MENEECDRTDQDAGCPEGGDRKLNDIQNWTRATHSSHLKAQFPHPPSPIPHPRSPDPNPYPGRTPQIRQRINFEACFASMLGRLLPC